MESEDKVDWNHLVEERLELARQRAQALDQQARAGIRERPLLILALTMLVGFLLGRMHRR